LIAARAFATLHPMQPLRPALLLLLALAGAALADDLAPVRAWIAHQRSVKSIAADFAQTRALRTLRDPVVAHGKFWFRAPSSFRWQIGDPPKTIVLGDDKEIDVIQPRKKLVERSSSDQMSRQARARGFGMMSFPFAADFDDFQEQFEVLAVRTEGNHCHLELLPRDAQARRFLARIALDFDTDSGQLLTFEIVTREGSSMRTEFQNTRVNAPLDPALFRFDTTGYKVRDAK
jgi:outer membrane lipoprotein-sorting protein